MDATAAMSGTGFTKIKMTVPDELLKTRRTDWGWEQLQSKGDALVIPRNEFTDKARNSVHAFASSHKFRIRIIDQVHDDGPNKGKTVTEPVYFDKSGKEVNFLDIPEELRADQNKLAKKYTMKEMPTAKIVVRVTEPSQEELDKRTRQNKGHPRSKAPTS
jgi:hypothetical protein